MSAMKQEGMYIIAIQILASKVKNIPSHYQVPRNMTNGLRFITETNYSFLNYQKKISNLPITRNRTKNFTGITILLIIVI